MHAALVLLCFTATYVFGVLTFMVGVHSWLKDGSPISGYYRVAHTVVVIGSLALLEAVDPLVGGALLCGQVGGVMTGNLWAIKTARKNRSLVDAAERLQTPLSTADESGPVIDAAQPGQTAWSSPETRADCRRYLQRCLLGVVQGLFVIVVSVLWSGTEQASTPGPTTAAESAVIGIGALAVMASLWVFFASLGGLIRWARMRAILTREAWARFEGVVAARSGRNSGAYLVEAHSGRVSVVPVAAWRGLGLKGLLRGDTAWVAGDLDSPAVLKVDGRRDLYVVRPVRTGFWRHTIRAHVQQQHARQSA